MCSQRWELPLLDREMRTQGCDAVRCAQLLLFMRSPLPRSQSHLCQDAAVVTSQLTVPCTRAVPRILWVTTRHLCWTRTSSWTWSADHPPCPLLTDSWDKAKRVHLFSLCLIPDTYQGSVAPLFPSPSVQGPSAAAWQEANKRKDLKIWRRKTGEEGRKEHLRFRSAVLCFEVLFQRAEGSWWEGHSEELSL